jgi:hypothetical protein
MLGINVNDRDAAGGSGRNTHQNARGDGPEPLQGDRVGRGFLEAMRTGGPLIGVAGEAGETPAGQLKRGEQRVGGGRASKGIRGAITTAIIRR